MQKGYAVMEIDGEGKPIKARGIFPDMEQAMKQSAAVGDNARIGLVHFDIVSISIDPAVMELDAMGIEVIVI